MSPAVQEKDRGHMNAHALKIEYLSSAYHVPASVSCEGLKLNKHISFGNWMYKNLSAIKYVPIN